MNCTHFKTKMAPDSVTYCYFTREQRKTERLHESLGDLLKIIQLSTSRTRDER